MKGLIPAAIGVVIGVFMLPVVTDSIASINTTPLSSSAVSLLNILPTIYILVIFVGTAAYVYFSNKN
jgi:hypothetical protein